MTTAGLARIAARYPRVWHVIEADGAGPWLLETGLLPAIELYGDHTNRVDYIRIALGGGGIAVLRPQLMPDHRLLPTLAGAFAGRPDLWRRHIDSHVFFWATADRRDRFTAANMRERARRDIETTRPPLVLEFDTAALLKRHAGLAYYATFNTGSTVRGGARVRRDPATFRSAADYRSGPVAELAIRGRVTLSGACQNT